jgi:hypothetical protein
MRQGRSLQRSVWCASYSAAGFVCVALDSWRFAIGAWIVSVLALVLP